jgi:hypothetical protein
MYNSTMTKMKLPPEVLARFRAFGREGAKKGASIGGKKSATSLTRAQRVARARAAGKASGTARAKAARKRKKSSQ